jgi:hypothetical protein
MSALRIRYETMQLKKRYETHALLPEQTLHLLLLTEDAYRQWAARYPRDPWVPSTGFLIAQLYEELPGSTSRGRAIALFGYITSHFPKTPYAARSSAQLKRGVPIRPYPAWARPPVTPSPAPSAAPTAVSSAAPSATPKGALASPAPTVSPSERIRLSHDSHLNRVGFGHRERTRTAGNGDYRP